MENGWSYLINTNMWFNIEHSTCRVTQSLSCSLEGLGEPVDCGVTPWGGLWTQQIDVDYVSRDRQTALFPFMVYILHFCKTNNKEIKHKLCTE